LDEFWVFFGCFNEASTYGIIGNGICWRKFAAGERENKVK